MDAGKVTAPTLLDLSAACDTMDHTILLRRLDGWFGVTAKSLQHLQLRKFKTRHMSSSSGTATVRQGVMQAGALQLVTDAAVKMVAMGNLSVFETLSVFLQLPPGGGRLCLHPVEFETMYGH